MASPETSESNLLQEKNSDPLKSIVDPGLYAFLANIITDFPEDEGMDVPLKPIFEKAMPQIYGEVERTPTENHSLYESMYKRIIPLIEHEVITPKDIIKNRASFFDYDDMLSALSYLWVKEIYDKTAVRYSYTYEALKITAGMWGDDPRARKMDKAADEIEAEVQKKTTLSRERANQYNGRNSVPARYWWNAESEFRLSDKLKSITVNSVNEMIDTCNVMIAGSAHSTKEKAIDLYMFKLDAQVLAVISKISEINRAALGQERKKGTQLEEFMNSLKVISGYLTQYQDKITNLDELYSAITKVSSKN